MTESTLPPATPIEDLLDALLAHVAAEDARTVDLPEPVSLIPFPTPFDAE